MIIFMVLLIVVVVGVIASYIFLRYEDEFEYNKYSNEVKYYRKNIYYYHDDNVE